MQFHSILQRRILYLFVILTGLLMVSPAYMEFKLQLHKMVVAQKMKAQSNLSTLEYPVSDWSRMATKGQLEVQINGKMFDISSIIVKNGNVRVAGKFDGLEDELLKHFVDFFDNAPVNHHSKVSFVFFHFLYYEENGLKIPDHFTEPESIKAVTFYQHQLLKTVYEFDVPPPRNSIV